MSESLPATTVQADVRELQRRIDTLNAEAWELRDGNLERAIQLSEEASALATSGAFEAEPYAKGWADALRTLGYGYVRLSKLDLALSSSLKALALYETLHDQTAQALMLSNVGTAFWLIGDYADALDYQLRALRLCLSTGDREGQARSLNLIGLVYGHLGEHAKSLPYFEECLQVSREIGYRLGEAHALNNAGDTHRYLGDYEKALTLALQAVRIFQSLGHKLNEAQALDTVGQTYVSLGDYAEALTYFQAGLALTREINNKHQEAVVLLNLGDVCARQRQMDERLAYLQQALAIAQLVDTKRERFQAHLALAEAYKERGDYQQALAHYQQFHAVKEAAFNERADTKLKSFEVVHQVENARKEAEIYQLRTVALEHEIQERKKAEAALRALATTDALTGVFNRHHFFELAKSTLAFNYRHSRHLSAIMLDIDHFKRVNDTHGHVLGDQVLRAVAQVILNSVRGVDIVGRYGGEEFVLLLPGTHEAEAYQVAERLRAALASQPIVTEQGDIPLTISLGIASQQGEHDTLEALLARADQALYAAKRAGRNQVQVYAA